MILFEANIAIRCRNCGELYKQSLLQRDNETTQYEGGKTWLGMQEKKEVKLTNENSIKCNYFNV